MKVMHRLSKPKIGIVRGLMPRFTQAEFACSFKRFEPTFITGEARGEIKDFCNKEKLNTRDLRLKKVIKNTRLFIARSYKAKRALLKLGIPKEKIRVVYHGVNLRRFRGSRRNRGHREIVILYVGEMEEYKGVGDLLKIWPEIYKKHPHANLWLVGKGSLLEEAKGMTGVKVHGYVFYRNLPKIYSPADIFISPSKNG